MINPAHLDLFRAVLRHGGMTRAAVARGISQPHISRAIAQLEAEVGFRLFDRRQGSALPTHEGRAFAHAVELAAAGLDRLQIVAREIREGGAEPLRIACQPSLAARLVPRAIRRLTAEHPRLQVALLVPSPDTIWSWVASGQCDLGLARLRTGIAGVASAPFLAADAVCALPRGHVLARKRAIDAADLATEPLVAGAPGAFQKAVERAFAEAGIVPRFAFSAQYTAARCGMVAEGLGAAIVDPLPARGLGLPIVLRPFRPEVRIETVVVRPALAPVSNLAELLVAFLEAERDALALAPPYNRKSSPR